MIGEGQTVNATGKESMERSKLQLMKALVWLVATYCCESWALKKDDKKRLDAFEMNICKENYGRHQSSLV